MNLKPAPFPLTPSLVGAMIENRPARAIRAVPIETLALVDQPSPSKRSVAEEVAAEMAELEAHRAAARKAVGIGEPVPLRRPMPVERFVARGRDSRPITVSKAACPRCGIRGDIGCRHQRPDAIDG